MRVVVAVLLPLTLAELIEALDRRCRRCGCWEFNPCVDSSGCPCSWAAPDLCNFCDLEGFL